MSGMLVMYGEQMEVTDEEYKAYSTLRSIIAGQIVSLEDPVREPVFVPLAELEIYENMFNSRNMLVPCKLVEHVPHTMVKGFAVAPGLLR